MPMRFLALKWMTVSTAKAHDAADGLLLCTTASRCRTNSILMHPDSNFGLLYGSRLVGRISLIGSRNVQDVSYEASLSLSR
ncbi:unnamed protein product, partial [Dovyalis caffra]